MPCRYGSRNLFVLVSGVARRLTNPETQEAAFMSMQKLADIVGPKQFQGYIDRLASDQRSIYEELLIRMGNGASGERRPQKIQTSVIEWCYHDYF